MYQAGKIARFVNASVVLELGETNIRTCCLLVWCPLVFNIISTVVKVL